MCSAGMHEQEPDMNSIVAKPVPDTSLSWLVTA